ncbi:MAG: pentapeptide repeat-containing protein, partial [Tabrizicola sp.]
GADLSVATFAGTVILGADLTGAALKRTDFDGAVVFGEDFLTKLAGSAAAGTFRPELFRLDPVEPSDLTTIMVLQDALTAEDIATKTGGAKPFQVVRVGDFGP